MKCYKLMSGDGKPIAFGKLPYIKEVMQSALARITESGMVYKSLSGFPLDAVLIQNGSYATVWSIQEVIE